MGVNETFYAKTLKGLEFHLAEELKELGADRVRTRVRGVSFTGGRSLMYKVNLASRLALRVLVPVIRFEARDPGSLYRRIRGVEWETYLDNRMTFAIDPVVFSPYFTNSHYAALKAKDAIVDRFRQRTHLRPSVSRDRPDLLVNLHISGSNVTLSLDSSGGSLHRRGYRSGSFPAPLNEVLAAGMIRISGWNGETPFVDPMCGSGTLAIEAALIAAGIPPGIFRSGFGFEKWKDFDAGLMEHVARSLPGEKEAKVPIIARDIDPEAVHLTRRHIRALELDHLVSCEAMDFSESPEMEGATLVMNPPYGERLNTADLEATYSMIGSTLKHRFPGCRAWLLTSSRQALKRVGLKPSSKHVLYNGSLECSFVNYRTFKGTLKDQKQC